MPEYKMIYRPYKFDEIKTKARSEKKGSNWVEAEAVNWSNALSARKQWKVQNSGAIQSGPDVIFWALLEKTN